MTLFKQMAFLISIFLLIILTTVLVLNFNSQNEAIQERLYEDAKNTASSLSLSLGSADGDTSMMSTMINANFDSGNYNIIKLVDVDNKLIYERKDEHKIPDVPEWFLNSTSIEAPMATANVSAGWSQVGILYVKSDTSYAYKQLYSFFINLIISFGVIFVIGLAVLNLLLMTILKPLRRVQTQAEAVIKNEFITQENIPYTKEFRDVVVGMNIMVKKAKAMFDKGNEELKKQKELEYTDPSTKLKNRKYLIDKLPEYLKIDASCQHGINMLLALSGVIEANEKIGRQAVNELFIRIANIFTDQTKNDENAIVSRINGTEFSILLPHHADNHGLDLANNIFGLVNDTIAEFGLDEEETFISIGIYEYNYKQSISEVLSHSDNALSRAKFSASHIHLDKAEHAVEVMGKEAWKKIINEALELNNFDFTSYLAVDTKHKRIAHDVLSLTLKTTDNTTYSYGQFMASANEAGLSSKIYKNIIDMLFTSPSQKLKDSTCSLRLSYEYLDLVETYQELFNLVSNYAKKLPFKLIIEIPDRLIRKNPKGIKLYKSLFEKYNIDIGIYEFIGENDDYQYLQDLRPIYIKAQTDYFLSQSDQALSALRLITDTVGISLIASSVMDLETLEKLQQKDIFIIQGKVTELITLI